MTGRAPTASAPPAPHLMTLVAGSPLFSVLSPRHQQQVCERFTRHECRAGIEVVRQGHASDAVFLLERGRVGAYVKNAAEGLTQLVSVLSPPETFGTAALLSDSAASASYVALDDSVVYRLGREVFDALAKQSPEFSLVLARELARQIQGLLHESAVPWVDLSRWTFDERLWANVPASVASGMALCPLELAGDVMTVAMADPRDATTLDSLRRALPGVRLRVMGAASEDLSRFIGHGARAALRRTTTTVTAPTALPRITFVGYEEPSQHPGPRISAAPPTPAVALVDELVATGLVTGASDIHIEHERDGVGVRYRVDGILRARRDRITAENARPIVSRLKLLARLDITETRKPQDGRISVRLDNGRLVDLRVSTLPSKFGEKVALRILDSEAAIRDLRTLFPVERVRTLFLQLISRATGLVLVSGPTGSGKSTTLYSALHVLRSDDLNIMTVEDPIEYHIDGITQVEAHAETGTSFARVLRALLRQDPNVILVGEMRDPETARIAVEASLTGHLVLSSVHTNGAIEAVARLMDMGVEPYAMANGLLGVTHQRLVKRVCAECVQPFEYPAVVIEPLYRHGVLAPNQEVTLVRGAGCERCNGTGVAGRLAVHSALVVNDEVRDAIGRGVALTELQRAASGGAHLDLAKYAGALLRGGFTVPSEVMPLLQRVEA